MFRLRLGDGRVIFVPATVNMSEILAYTSLIFNKQLLISRHGHTGQGQRICTAKPGLRTGKVEVTRF